ncbi:MAG: ribosomal-processing cysteine protease Prp [Clostridium sp.]|uniref:ribosomal-processing cysteine protease Prp n=1 Tax=Clostridium sp. DSM 8431 TaxID=1761781 RepID=UPI0008EDF003|nr:ribosomal-processing cysteine protease Prp [Clostridium sp. DSM 8431]MCR4944250.1 ribosomal-processing cysteine protease Prp [Clostridium sp.]SFU66521.1 hypothetical protein SAMN04487886_109314 [Clostridium sp. DSM 8431]
MIEIKIRSDKENILSFKISDHALRDRDAIMAGDAYDMVCNTVSVLSQSVIIGLDEVLKLNCNYEMMDGYLAVDLEGFTPEEICEAQVLLKTFKLSLDSVILSLDQSFGKDKREKYISLKLEEV